MIVTLTPNPAIDQTYRLEALRVGESHRVGAPVRRAGGKGVNTAAVLAQLGVEHRCVAAIEQELLQWWREDLATRWVQEVTLPVPPSHRTRVSTTVVEANGTATVLNEAGSTPPVSTWDQIERAVLAALDTPGGHSVLAICGSLPTDCPPEPLLRLVRASTTVGHTVVVDGAGPWLRQVAALCPALVKCNRDEALDSTGADDPMEAAARLVEDGAQAALISLGADGILLLTDPASKAWRGHPRWRARPAHVLRGNPTGAGDAATAAVARALAGGRVEPESLLVAVVATSAAAVLQPLAGDIDPADIERLAPGVTVERL